MSDGILSPRRGHSSSVVSTVSTTSWAPVSVEDVLAGSPAGLGLELPVGVKLVSPPSSSACADALPSFGNEQLWQGKGRRMLARRFCSASGGPFTATAGAGAGAGAPAGAGAATGAAAAIAVSGADSASAVPSLSSSTPVSHRRGISMSSADDMTKPPLAPRDGGGGGGGGGRSHSFSGHQRSRASSATVSSAPPERHTSRLHDLLRLRSETLTQYHTSRWSTGGGLPSVSEHHVDVSDADVAVHTPTSTSTSTPVSATGGPRALRSPMAPTASLTPPPFAPGGSPWSTSPLPLPGQSPVLRTALSSRSLMSFASSSSTAPDAGHDAREPEELALLVLLRALEPLFESAEYAVAFCSGGGVPRLLQAVRLTHSRPSPPVLLHSLHVALASLVEHAATAPGVRAALAAQYGSLADHLGAVLVARYAELALGCDDASDGAKYHPHGLFVRASLHADDEFSVTTRLLYLLEAHVSAAGAVAGHWVPFHIFLDRIAYDLQALCLKELSASSTTEWGGIAAALLRSMTGYRDVDDAAVAREGLDGAGFSAPPSPALPRRRTSADTDNRSQDTFPSGSVTAFADATASSDPPSACSTPSLAPAAASVPVPHHLALTVVTSAATHTNDGDIAAATTHGATVVRSTGSNSRASRAAAAAAAPSSGTSASSVVGRAAAPAAGATAPVQEPPSSSPAGRPPPRTARKTIPSYNSLSNMIALSQAVSSMAGTLRVADRKQDTAARWVVVDNGKLAVHLAAGSAEPLMVRSLAGASVVERDHGGGVFGRVRRMVGSTWRFELLLTCAAWPEQVRLFAESAEDRDRWLKALMRNGTRCV